MSTQIEFPDVSETPGQPASQEQLASLYNRYAWASTFCRGRDVVDVACGAGLGLGLLNRHARSLEASDINDSMIALATGHYRDRIPIHVADAQRLPYDDSSKDVLVIFEALYYLPNVKRFVEESKRVLRPGGLILICLPNKDLYDFNPSPLSVSYFGPGDLHNMFSCLGFSVRCYGHQAMNGMPVRQKLLRPVKWLAVSCGIMPKTMRGKRWLKRLAFGGLVRMPAELEESLGSLVEPTPISNRDPDDTHKVLYCIAELR